MRDVCQGEYKDYLEIMDYEKVIEALTMEGAEILPKSFDVKYLKKVSHFWKYFIYSRLIPPQYIIVL